MTDKEKQDRYLELRAQGLCRFDAIRKVLAEERLPHFVKALKDA